MGLASGPDRPSRAGAMLSLCAQQHAEEVARLVRIGQEVELLEEARARDAFADVAQGGEVLDGG